MTPSSDKNSPIDSKSRKDLLNAIGNPNATEAEWLSACERLGEHQVVPKSRRKKTALVVSLCALSSVAIGAFVYRDIRDASFKAACQRLDQVAKAPVPVPAPEPNAAVEWGPYMSDLQIRIKRAWFPPKGNESKHIKVRFKVFKDGHIDNLKLWDPSGVQPCDAAALRAVVNAGPFKPLPANAPADADIEFTFDYNVFRGEN